MQALELLIATATLEQCKAMEQLIKQRRAQLAKPRVTNLDQVKLRVDWSLAADYAIAWQREVVQEVVANARGNFDQAYAELVGDYGLTTVTAARQLEQALRSRVAAAMHQRAKEIQDSLPKSAITVAFDPSTDRYVAYRGVITE